MVGSVGLCVCVSVCVLGMGVSVGVLVVRGMCLVGGGQGNVAPIHLKRWKFSFL